MKLGLLISLTTLIAWLAHVLLVGIYRNWIDDTKSMVFRSVHGIEIFAVALIAFLVFLNFAPKAGLVSCLVIALATLVLIDLIFFAIYPKAWSVFDLWHVVVAYSAFCAGIIIAKLLV